MRREARAVRFKDGMFPRSPLQGNGVGGGGNVSLGRRDP